MHKLSKIFFLWMITSCLWAQKSPITTQMFKLTQIKPMRLTVKAKDIFVLKALENIARLANKNLYIDKKDIKLLRQRKISIYLEKRPLGQILEIIAGAQGFSYSLTQGNITINASKPKHFKLFLARHPRSVKIPQVYFSLGTFWLFKNKNLLALNQYRNLYRKVPNHKLAPYTLLLSAKILIMQKKYEEARKVLSLFFNEHSKHHFITEAFLLLATCHFRERDWPSALKVYKHLLNQRKDRNENFIHLNIGKIHFAKKQYKLAMDYFLKVVDSKAEKELRAKAMLWFIKCLYQRKKYSQVKDYSVVFYREFNKSVVYKQVQLLHAKVHFELEEYLQVYYLLKPLLYIKNFSVAYEAQNLTVQALEKVGLWQQMIEVLGKMKKMEKSLRYKYAYAYQRLEQWENAKEQLQKIGADNGRGYLAILECDFAAKDYRTCISNFAKFRDQMPKKILQKAFALVGHSFKKLGLLDKALLSFSGEWKEDEEGG